MQIIKEKYEIEETLNKRVKNILMFLNIKAKLERGNIINISKTNIAYIEPHLHCVVVPLIKKYDKRTNTEKYTISKKHYMKSGNYISELQDKYWKRMNDNGFKLERGIKNSDNEHISIKEFKKLTRKLDNRMEKQNYLMTRDYDDMEIDI